MAMQKLRILSVGKTKETWLDEAISEYQQRLSKVLTFEFIWAKNDAQLLLLAVKEPLALCLDATGTLMNSPTFSSFIMKKFEEGGSRLTMIIGGAEGLPEPLKQRHALISFSPMTFTHQMIRLILVEQIYRAFEIDKGSNYHK